MKAHGIAAVACLCLALPALATGQTRPPTIAGPKPQTRPVKKPTGPKFFVFAGASGLFATDRFSQNITFPLFLEEASITGTARANRNARAEVGGGFWIMKRLGIGVTIGYGKSRGALDATYSLPSPFVFNQPKSVDGSATAHRTVLSADIDALVPVVTQKHWQIVVIAGPSVTSLKQQIATDLFTYSYSYPFDSITLAPGSGGGQSAHAIGGHAGFRVVFPFNPHLAVVGDVQYRTAKVTLQGQDSTFKAETGGPTGGVSFRFSF